MILFEICLILISERSACIDRCKNQTSRIVQYTQIIQIKMLSLVQQQNDVKFNTLYFPSFYLI